MFKLAILHEDALIDRDTTDGSMIRKGSMRVINLLRAEPVTVVLVTDAPIEERKTLQELNIEHWFDLQCFDVTDAEAAIHGLLRTFAVTPKQTFYLDNMHCRIADASATGVDLIAIQPSTIPHPHLLKKGCRGWQLRSLPEAWAVLHTELDERYRD